LGATSSRKKTRRSNDYADAIARIGTHRARAARNQVSLAPQTMIQLRPLQVAALSIVTVLGCGSADETVATDKPAAETETLTLDEYIRGLPDLALAAVQPKTEVGCSMGLCPLEGQEGESYCTYTTFAETGHFDDFIAFQPNSATLWPGVIVRGKDAEQGLLAPIGVELAPVRFSVSLENIEGSPVGDMAEPSLSSFREERNRILSSDITGATPAALDFQVTEVNSESQLSLALGASVSWPGGGDIAASFDFSSTERRTKLLVNFTQAYYTIDVDTHAQPSAFFAPSVSIEDVEPWADAVSPPLYVQSITYGRRVIFSIETNEEASAVEAALLATYSTAVKVSVDVSAEQRRILEESSIRAFVVGGSGTDATGAIHGFEGLVDYIENGGDYSKDSPGAPIAYKLAYLDNEVTQFAFTSEYSERDCDRNRGVIHAELRQLEHISGGDLGGNVELYGEIVLRHPVENGAVQSCDEGGAVMAIWSLPEGSFMKIPKGEVWVPNNPMAIEIENVPFGKDQKICISVELWEDDGFFSADDSFGTDQVMVGYEQGWEGTHILMPRGEGENAIDVLVDISLR